MNKLRLTVIIALWRPELLEQKFKNLDEQTYKHFDVIIVNDGKQEIRDLVPNAIKDRPNYFFIDNHTRCHYYGAISRNMAVCMAFMRYKRDRSTDDEFVVMSDDDVLFSPDLFQEMADAHERNPQAKMILPQLTEIRGKINKDYRHIRKTTLKPQNVDLNGLAFNRLTMMNNGLLNASPRHKITYDWELIKKIYEQVGDTGVEFTKNDSRLIFYHKRR